MRLIAAVIALIVFGWALLAAAESRVEPVTVSQPDVIVRTVVVEPETVTPFADSLIDWDEQERQSDCLWTFMQDSELELTLEMVWAAGEVADALGGACYLIGEDE
ncbi:MAG TPA: hypothetical protein VIG24_15180 [Acidimicrobiia bacterium]